MRGPGRALFVVLLFVAAAVGCGPSLSGDDDTTNDGATDTDGAATDAPATIDAPDIDALDTDAVTAYPDAPLGDSGSCSNWMCTNPVNDNCMIGTSDICGNGLDDNCNGQVDEGCACSPGAVQQCFLGQPGRRGVGACVDGMQTCQGTGEFPEWGPCQGGIRPGAEACDSVDNDCNGCVDDDPGCCVVNLACPSSMPDGEPFQNYVIDGTQFFTGAVLSWTWTVTGGPCDQLLQQTVGTTTYTVSGANTSTLTLVPTLSGDYTIHVTIVAADGNTYECTFIVHIRGPGLRIEMCSDRTNNTDIDLHLHRPDTAASGWFYTATTDTCFYGNCKSTSTSNIPNWGYANSPLAECVNGPGGAGWQTLGYCRNPRLDVDSIFDSGVPENINIDIPQNGKTYRVMVNYYSGSGVAHPMVNVYCGGYLRGTYGQAPDLVTGFDVSGSNSSGDIWRVVDVTPVVVGGNTTDCTLDPIHPPNTTMGYWVATTPRTY